MKKEILSLITSVGCIVVVIGMTGIRSFASGNEMSIEKLAVKFHELSEEDRSNAIIHTLEYMLLKYVDEEININLINDTDTNKMSISFGQFIGSITNRTFSIDLDYPHWKEEIKYNFRDFIIDGIGDVIRQALKYREELNYKHIGMTDEFRNKCKLSYFVMKSIVPWINKDEISLVLDKVTEKPLIILQNKIEECKNKSDAMKEALGNRNTKIKNSIDRAKKAEKK